MVVDKKNYVEIKMFFKNPKFKLYKRENINLFLKNILISDKFLSKLLKKNINNFLSNKNFSIFTHFSDQLKEKRKLKILYGISDKKYNIYYNKSKKMCGNTFINVLTFLERRLDNFLFRCGFSTTRRESKQIINHKFIKVNNKISNYNSLLLNPGDYVSLNYNKSFYRKNYFEEYFKKSYFPS